MQKGTIVLLPFPFTDLSGSKVRPALVLYVDALDVTVTFLTTRMDWAGAHDVKIKSSESNGLKKDSLVRLSKIATIERNLIMGELGRLSSDDIAETDKGLAIIFQLNTII